METEKELARASMERSRAPYIASQSFLTQLKKNAVPRGNQKAVRDDVGGVRTLFYAVDIVGHDKQ